MPHLFYAGPAQREKGVSLIVVLLILVVVSILGVGSAQIALQGEHGARNDRDMQLAWQAAEAALQDAEFDIHGPGTGNRSALFGGLQDTSSFITDCGDQNSGPSSKSLGLCAMVTSGTPAWLKVDFTVTGTAARTVKFGTFTGRSFAASDSGATHGIEPYQAPRYVIEPIPDPGNRDASATGSYVYRVTAMGFGPRKDIQAVTQIIYRN
ncbi:PilX N-terminal domain-containing pilus assembly protein [Variovorax soli]|uniref:Type IV pilus assembly protein PilX n=1 Tax=Variovorax soli TaxID=376815 RepID=A0ABU1NGQ3_9BURK|nr:PilX N-terminal domain-containing pilus assembly protein [Variovorax soli]MDR6537619.1 type IV pilus assembly protein PilX [Variovorax soli]